MKHSGKIVVSSALALVAAAPALAHPGHGGHSIVAGFLHPLTGADHLLAMLAVGLLASRKGGRAQWLWPLTFVTAMLVGYGFGLTIPGVPLAEPAILASVIVFGTLIAAKPEIPLALGVPLIAVFGMCHGYAHGVESPVGTGLGFPLGFALTTAALHGTGLFLGIMAQRLHKPNVVRFAGLSVAAAGVLLAVAG